MTAPNAPSTAVAEATPAVAIDFDALLSGADAAAAPRSALEQAVHAQVMYEFDMLTASAFNKAEYTFIIWDAPLLTEAGMHMKCSLVLLNPGQSQTAGLFMILK